MNFYRRNHYVPQWYQAKFLPQLGEKKFFYLDLKPEHIEAPNGKKYLRKELRRLGTPESFFAFDLYTTVSLQHI